MIAILRTDEHRTALWRELDSIIEQIEEHPFDLLGIGLEELQVRLYLQHELHAAALHARPEGVDDSFQETPEIDLLTGRVEGREAIEARKLNELFDAQ